MYLSIPIYVTQTKTGFTAQPLFITRAARTDENLNRLFMKLTRELTKHLESLARESRHDDLARWTFSPTITTHRHTLRITLKNRVITTKYLLIAFDHLDRRIAMSPSVPDVWFEVKRGDLLEMRAEAVYTDYWRKQERDSDESETIDPNANGLYGQAWVQNLALTFRTRHKPKETSKQPFLLFAAESQPDGASELSRVGRNLDWLYPDELDRAVLRDREATELLDLLQHRDGRSVVMVGPRQCGKTTILHEVVYRRMLNKKPSHHGRSNVWLISPQRLISGMSYVGQWEARLLAILKHSAKRDHILYFDDLLGLFFAGQTSQSTLNAAMVMKPYLEDRRVRVLGEVSPEQFRVLQERDRGFADLFHVLPITEPSDSDTLRMVIHHQKQLERRHGCRFELDSTPSVLDLTRRYERELTFPGKACHVLTRLAVRVATKGNSRIEFTHDDPFRSRPSITREDVLEDLVTRSGLTKKFLDPRERLDRDQILEQLQKHVIGQVRSVEALADVISIAKARLNDPDRPLASFLFLGPTGVGKTECAKAAARVLFGSDDRMLRFDLNEFNQPGSAARLVGTFGQPEGLLTSAIRRQPFAVILFDEIEKADRDVYDVLLQVLGEGRLTDALGRTANFTNAIIIMTSNLGVRDAEGNLGFGGEREKSDVYRRAAEKFFRPEFFNRIDRVIPFTKLTREEMGTIARKLVNDVLSREGFSQRQCVLIVSPAAIERVIDIGYDPALGARAMKRAVERMIAQPSAGRLAALDASELTIVQVQADTDSIRVELVQPGFAEPVPQREHRGIDERLDECYATLDRLDEWLTTIRPHGAIGSHVTAEQQRYFAVKEQVDSLAAKLELIQEHQKNARLAKLEIGSQSSLGRRPRYTLYAMPKNSWSHNKHEMSPMRRVESGLNMVREIEEFLTESHQIEDDELHELDQQLALMRVISRCEPSDHETYLVIRSPIACDNLWGALIAFYRIAWNAELGLEAQIGTVSDEQRLAILRIQGIHAQTIARTEIGTHLFWPTHGGPIPLVVDVVNTVEDAYRLPWVFRPIVRVYPENKPIVDVRTGLVMPRPFNAAAFRAFTLNLLPRE